jgi:hypothetical protein
MRYEPISRVRLARAILGFLAALTIELAVPRPVPARRS